MATVEPSLAGLDRREYPRVRYFTDVEIEWGSSKVRARTHDISQGGMLIEMDNPLWLHAEFLARLWVGDGAPVEVNCAVRRILPGVGMGVEFIDLKPPERTHLREVIEGLPH